MWALASTLVVDAAVLVAAARARSAGAPLQAARAAALGPTDRVVDEAPRRIELGLRPAQLLAIIDGLLAEMTPVPWLMPVLRDASRAGMGRGPCAANAVAPSRGLRIVCYCKSREEKFAPEANELRSLE
jgi:hypothetical protein